jgi:chaperonin cofactor prefoldin
MDDLMNQNDSFQIEINQLARQENRTNQSFHQAKGRLQIATEYAASKGTHVHKSFHQCRQQLADG